MVDLTLLKDLSIKQVFVGIGIDALLSSISNEEDYLVLLFEKKKSFALPSCLPASRKRKQSTQVPQLDSISALHPCVQRSCLPSEIKAQGLQNSQPFPPLDFLAQPFHTQVVCVSGLK